MKKILIFLFVVIAHVSFGQTNCALSNLLTELKTNTDLSDAIKGNPELVDSFKVLDDAGVSSTIKTNPANLDAVNSFKKSHTNVPDQDIADAIGSLKSNRRQAFINGLKNVSDNDLGLTKSRKAFPNEVRDAVNNLRDFRKSRPDVLGRSNVARLDGTIDGRSMSELSEHTTWVGGEQNVLTPRPANQQPIWEASEVQTSSGFTYLADVDSEYNMLTDLARKLEPNAKLGDVFSNHAGQIQIVSEIAYCTSCQGIIQKFNQMFPEIEIILIDGIK